MDDQAMTNVIAMSATRHELEEFHSLAAASLDEIGRKAKDSAQIAAVRTALGNLSRAARFVNLDALAGALEIALQTAVKGEETALQNQLERCRILLAETLPPAEVAPLPMPQEPPPIPGFNRLRIEFIDRLRGGMYALQESIGARDFKAVRTIGHNLKGTGTAYGFPAISEFGQALERDARLGDPGSLEITAKEYRGYLETVEIS